MHRQGSVESTFEEIAPRRKLSIAENADFQELLKRQKHILEE
jgi:hypothetical protein